MSLFSKWALRCVAAFVGVLPCGAFAQESVGVFSYDRVYSYDESLETWTESIRITGCSSGECVVIPSVIDGCEVTEIGPAAFQYNYNLKGVTIPAGVTTIGDRAFACCPFLRGIYFLGNAPCAGEKVLADASRLTVYYTPGAVGWEQGRFEGWPAWPMTFTYEINEGSVTVTGCRGTNGVVVVYRTIMGLPVTLIQSNAFANCVGLRSVTLPDSVAGIGGGAFAGCTALTGVYCLGDAPDAIASNAFDGASQATVYYQARKADWTGTFAGRPTEMLPVTYTMDGPDATFTGFASERSGPVIVPDEVGGCSITRIGYLAFCGRSGLTGVTLPNGLKVIGEGAFQRCRGLTAVSLPDSVVRIGTAAFADCANLSLIVGGAGVNRIGAGAFSGCASIKEIRLPSRLGGLGDQAFEGCSGATNIVWSEALRCIGESAFSGCAGLAEVHLPETVTNLGWWAFADCGTLSQATIPSGVEAIGAFAFSSCGSLTNIAVDAANGWYSSQDGVLYNRKATDLICFPGGRQGSFSVASGIEMIEEEAFAGCAGLTDVFLPSGVSCIGSAAFEGCAGLTNITVDASNGQYSSLEGVLFNKGRSVLIQYPPSRDASVYEVPPAVEQIAGQAFEGCTKLTRVEIPERVCEIGAFAFEDCAALEAINVASGNKGGYFSVGGVLFSAGQSAVIKCPVRKTGTCSLPAGVSSIDDLAFLNCADLTEVSIPDGVVSIGNAAFLNCDGLTSVALPASVSAIGDAAFFNCKGLSNISVDSGNPYYCDKGGVLYDKSKRHLLQCPGGKVGACSVDAGVGHISEFAFANCARLTSIEVDASNAVYASESGVLFDKAGGELLQCPGGQMGEYAMPSGVLGVQPAAFMNCSRLTSVTVSGGLAFVGDYAFAGCAALSGVYFRGDAPRAGANAFFGDSGATVYYRSDAAGWGASLAGRPAVPWTETPRSFPVVTQHSPEADTVVVKEGASLVFRIASGDPLVQGVTNQGMSNVTWYVDDVQKLVTSAGAPGRVSSGFTLKTDTDTVSGAASKEVLVRASACNRQGNVTTVSWCVQVVNVPERSQVIAFKPLAEQALETPAFDPKATSSSGLPVVYSSSDASVAQIEDGLIRVVGAGAALITASQPGDFEFKAAAPVKRSLTVKARLDAAVLSGVGTVKGVGLYKPGERVRLLAVPAADYTFTKWKDGVQDASRSLTMPASNVTVAAFFDLTTNVPPPVVGDPGAQRAVVGVPFVLPLDIQSESRVRIQVGGLPSGLAFLASSNTISGVASRIASGVTVTVTARNLSLVPTVRSFSLDVDALPGWAQGQFNGWCQSEWGCGSVAASVSAKGAVSGVLSAAGTNYTFVSASFARIGEDGTHWISTTARKGKVALPLLLAIRPPADAASSTLSSVDGWLSDVAEGTPAVRMWRNVWKEREFVAVATNATGYYTATLPGCSEYGSGYLTMTVDRLGGVKTAGKLADGSALSLSSPLILDEDGRLFAVLYSAPRGYKGGCVFGRVEFCRLSESAPAVLRPLDGEPFVWESRDPQATSVYGSGFSRTLGLTGGWYDKVGNLYDYYRDLFLSVGTASGAPVPEILLGGTSYPSAWWDPDGLAIAVVTNRQGVMTGLAAPEPQRPTPRATGYDYATATNTLGLTVRLIRATGVFKGSFRIWFDDVAAHTSKSVAFEGVLTPEHEDPGDCIAGRGFFLWPGQSQRIDSRNRAVSYPFYWSYDIKFRVSETASPYTYLIVDLSEGPTATRYPVSYLGEVPPDGWTDEYKTSKLVLRRVVPDTFAMGSPADEPFRLNCEALHQVLLTRAFYIGVFEVTQKQWERVMGDWPSWFRNTDDRDTRPVEQVCYVNLRGRDNGCLWPASSGVGAGSFMARLRACAGRAFDLPTEAQWEYACRAGSAAALNSGQGVTNNVQDAAVAAVGRYYNNGGSLGRFDHDVAAVGGTAKVGAYLPNAWGLYDMHGNVSEWCLDWFFYDYPADATDPKGAETGSFRVARGGDWSSSAWVCRSAMRLCVDPLERRDNVGFRLVLPLGEQ